MTSEWATTLDTIGHKYNRSTFLEALDFLGVLILVDSEPLESLVHQLDFIHLY